MKYLIVIMLLIAGCSATPKYELDLAPQMATQMKPLLDEHHIARAKVVMLGEQLVIATQVKPLHRLQKQTIERRLKKALTRAFPQQQIFLSTDYKIWLELQKIGTMQQQQLEKLRSLAEEET